MEEIIKVELTVSEAELFKKFREFQDDFSTLLENSVFSFKNGSAVIHRDDQGNIRKIEMHKIYFKS